MDKSRFDEILQKLVTKCRIEESPENPVRISSKLLEIDYTTRSIEQQLDDCKTSINETLKCYESTTFALDNLGKNRKKIAFLDDEMRHFEENLAYPRMAEIEKVRVLICAEINSDEDRKRLLTEREKIRETIRELNFTRDEFMIELTSVEENIRTLTVQVEDTSKRTKFLKMENAHFHAALEQEKKSLCRHNDESLAKLKILNPSSNS